MYVCMYVCMCACMHVSTKVGILNMSCQVMSCHGISRHGISSHAYIYTCIHACMHTCMSACIQLSTWTCHAFMHRYTYADPVYMQRCFCMTFLPWYPTAVSSAWLCLSCRAAAHAVECCCVRPDRTSEVILQTIFTDFYHHVSSCLKHIDVPG